MLPGSGGRKGRQCASFVKQHPFLPSVDLAERSSSHAYCCLLCRSARPRTITLDHGRSYVLRLANVADGGHDFTAPDFFAAANVAPEDRRLVAEGEVEVPPGQVREIRLTAPAPGSYKLKCGRSFHKMLGMSGDILVR